MRELNIYAVADAVRGWVTLAARHRIEAQSLSPIFQDGSKVFVSCFLKIARIFQHGLHLSHRVEVDMARHSLASAARSGLI